MIGSTGDDSYYIDHPGDTVTENAGEGNDTEVSWVSRTLTLSPNVEFLSLGGDQPISGTGNALGNFLYGNNNPAPNALAGGAGNDTYTVGAGDTVIELPSEGSNDRVFSYADFALSANVEYLSLDVAGGSGLRGIGNELANTLVGNAAANILEGLAGNDTLSGGLGNDTLDGGSGTDRALFNGTGGGTAAEYSINFVGGSTYTVTKIATGELDTLTDVESVQFTDTTVTLDTSGGAVSHAPSGTDKTISTPEDTPYTITAGDFGFSDANDSPPHTLQAVIIASLPTVGSLTLNNASVSVGQSISIANINGGLFRFYPTTDANGANYASFSFQVQDSGSSSNGGSILDLSANTLFFEVAAVNDEQIIATNTGATVVEGAIASTITSAMLTAADVDNTAVQLVYTLTALPASGSLRLSGNPLAPNATFTQADINAGLLTYSHDGSETSADSFSFSVDDGEGTATSGSFAIAVTPVNDNPPVIGSHGGAASVALSLIEGITQVTTVTAADPDLPPATLTFSLSGEDSSHFQIDSGGALSFVSGPNFEAPNDVGLDRSYRVTVTVSDGSLTDSQEFTVDVTDVNEFDVGPLSDANAAADTVAEDALAGTAVGITAQASDADATNSSVTYAFAVGGNPGELFAIDANTGVVTLAGALDYENASSHSITVTATSADGSSSSQSFSIAVGNVNESGVSVISDTDGADGSPGLDENTATGSTVGITALATDPDAGDTITYSLTNNAGGLFAIDANTGVVTLDAALDRESGGPSHTITVRADSLDGTHSTRDFTIAVDDVDEFDVSALDRRQRRRRHGRRERFGRHRGGHHRAGQRRRRHQQRRHLRLRRGRQSGRAVRHRCQHRRGHPGRRAGPRDRRASHTITVRRRPPLDGTPCSRASPSTVVNDVDEFDVSALTDTDAAADRLAEDALAGTRQSASPRGQRPPTPPTRLRRHHRLRLDDNAGGLFAIDANTGVVTLNAALDRESGGTSHTITVRADSLDGTHSTRDFTIAVNDVDEFDVSALTDANAAADTVAENALAGTAVGITAQASDADATNSSVTYAFAVGGNPGELLAIDANTGVVTLAGALDYENASSLSITVTATSADGSSSSQSFSIAVGNVNDFAPTIDSPSAFAAFENSLIAGTVTASDIDGDTLSFSLAGGDDAGLFAIDAQTGELSFIAPPDFEIPGDQDNDNDFVVSVRVSDGNAAHDQIVNLTVSVRDNNDAPGGANSLVALSEDRSYALSAADFGFSDAGDATPHNLQAVKLSSLPPPVRYAWTVLRCRPVS